jgi:mycofactocin precursor
VPWRCAYYSPMTNPPSTVVQESAQGADDDDLVEEDLLVEEISIDGMCGVY